jgi:integrase
LKASSLLRGIAPYSVKSLVARAAQHDEVFRAFATPARVLRAPRYEDSGLVFASEIGTPLDARDVTHKHFKPLLRRAGLPDIRFHDLRHSAATLLLSRGTHPTYVQQLLGHKSIKLTLDRYSHFMPSMGRASADGMDAALGI